MVWPSIIARSYKHSSLEIKLIFYFILYCFVIGFAFNPYHNYTMYDNWDATSYLSHAFTLGLDFDLGYTNEPTFLLKGCINPAKTSPCHPVGTGMLAAPFVALFSLIDRVQDHAILADHANYLGSWSYFGVEFASAFYFLAGIALYQRALRPWVRPVVTAAICLSTGILPYAVSKFAFGHSFEFFALALVFYGLVRLHGASTPGRILVFCLLVALGSAGTLFVRWVDIGYLSLPVVLALTLPWLAGERRSLLDRRTMRYLLFSYAGVLLSFAIVSLFYKVNFDVLWPRADYFYAQSRYTHRGRLGLIIQALSYLKNVPSLLFSSEYGVFYTFPVFPAAAAVSVYLWLRNLRHEPLAWTIWFLGVAFGIGIPLFLVLIWQTTASAYGYRYLLPALPTLMVPFALFLHVGTLERLYRKGGEWASGATTVVLAMGAVLTCISLVAQFGFLKLPGFSISQQVNVFGVMHRFSAKGYMDAVFAAILNIDVWRDLYRASLLQALVVPTRTTRLLPQAIEQYRILALIVPALGAAMGVLAATHSARSRLRAALVLSGLVIVAWGATSLLRVPSRDFTMVTFGTPASEYFIGRGFRKEDENLRLAWIVARPAELHGRLPDAGRVRLKARLYNDHPGQELAVAVDGREVGRFAVPVGYSDPVLDFSLLPQEAGAPATLQFLVGRIEATRANPKAALGVMVEWVQIEPLPAAP
jgi:hypothetical protein